MTQEPQDLSRTGTGCRGFADVKPVDRSLLVQEDDGGTSDQAITRMFFSNAQLLNSLEILIDGQAKG